MVQEYFVPHPYPQPQTNTLTEITSLAKPLVLSIYCSKFLQLVRKEYETKVELV